MVRFLALDQGQVVMGADWQALSDVRQAGAEALWVDLVSPSEEDLETIGAAFGFHPLTLDDCRDRQHRAKVREFEGHFFAILNAVGRRQNGERLVISATEIDFFVGQNYVVSVHRDQVGAIDTFWGQAKRAEVLRQGADFLFYYLCDLIVDEHFPILDRIDGLLDKLEARAFSQPDQAVLKELFHLKRQLIHLRRILGPERDVFNVVVRRDFPYLRPQVHLYFLDVYDHMVRLIDTIDTYRDMLSNAMEGYLSSVSNRLNEVMKVLTIIATIMMPLTVITGIYGMNFERMPFLRSSWGFYGILGVMAAVAVGMLFYFRRKRWL